MINRPIPFPILSALALSAFAFSIGRGADAAQPETATNTPATVEPASPSSTGVSPLEGADRPTTYSVAAGDTLWDLSHKFNCSIKSLKTLNKLKKNSLKPGQVLQIPPAKGTPATKKVTDVPPKTAKAVPVTTAAKSLPKVASSHSKALKAQPVQDFDISASTFASCPVTPSNLAAAPEQAPAASILKAKPVADTSISEDVSSSPTEVPTVPATDTPPVAKPVIAAVAPAASPVPAPAATFSSPTRRAANSKGFATIFTNDAPASDIADVAPKASLSGEWGNRFLLQARTLGDRGIGYAESWRPEGESSSWSMDCSNTSRYLYKVTAGIDLPRTASDQYYYLHLQGKAWDVPQASNGFADCNYLRANLKPGDLLFWENTYKPERQPPITHVMIFLGSNDKGEWIMAGSQTSRGGEHNRRHGGPDIYIFDPTKPCGGYTTWLGLSHHQGRFCAFGRPLEADVKKLSVADNN